jgi:uridine kinase
MMNQILPYYLIGITGGSASGKSLLIHNLRNIFSEKELCIISQDDYYKPLAQQQKDEFGVHNFDLPESIDSGLMYNDLLTLAAGKEVIKKEYVFELKDKEPLLKKFKPAPVVIVEGIFVFAYTAVSSLIEFSVYVDCDADLRYERRIKRDVVDRGIAVEKVIHQWKYHVMPAHEKYVNPVKKIADIIINNYHDMSEGLDLVSNHIHAILNRKT